MNILCTGGAGYVGSACLRYLLNQGHEAYAYDDLRDGNKLAVPQYKDRLIVGGLADRRLLEDTLDRYNIEAVMHFAAVASVPESIAQPSLYWEVNVVGTKNLLDAMVAQNVLNIVFSSTAATYSFSDKMPIEESDLQQPATPYGSTKLTCETMLAEYSKAYNIGFTAMRYFNASGADLSGEFGEYRKNESHLIPLALQTAIGARDKLFVYGNEWDTRDGSCIRDYVHVEDIAQAHTLAMESQTPGAGRYYNIGSEHGASVLEIIAACEKASGRPITWEYALPRPGDPATLIASSQKLRTELSWKPKHDLNAIVESASRWHTSHPAGYQDQ